jgi:hypothetical protein
MLRLRNFITEKVNDTNRLKHLSHLEDLIFEEGAVGLADAIESLKIYSAVLHNKDNKTKITTKWDGSPSIIIHDSGSDFWVASKSAFNATPKVNRTEQEIKDNHGHAPGLVEKLTYALKYCKELGINGTVQGDFLYTDTDLKPQTIDGIKHVTFKPNTIVYAVPVDSDLGRRILASRMGLIIHTAYSGSEPASMKASTIGSYSAAKLKKSRNVFFDDALIKDQTARLTMSASEQARFDVIIDSLVKIKGLVPASFLNYIADHDSISAQMAKYNNSNVRAGSYTAPGVDAGFARYVHDELQKDIDKLKSPAGKQKKEDVRKEVLTFLDKHTKELNFAYNAFALLVEAKMMIVKKLNTIESMRAFVEKGNALVPTNPEGFVAVQDNRVVKLVDRLEFSRNNFLRRVE